ncbi:MAG: hypothetical protein ABMA25_14755 [Ilumatobacteraceae bacterium]
MRSTTWAKVSAAALLLLVAACGESGTSGTGAASTSSISAAPTTVADSTVDPTTAPTSTIVAPPAYDGVWSRECVDLTGTGTESPADAYEGRSFGPLALQPGMKILYPFAPPVPMYGDPVSSVRRVPGGVLVSLQGYTEAAGGQSIIAVVDHAGSVRWRRCLSNSFRGPVVLDVPRGVIDVDIVATDGQTTEWWAFDLLTGESEIETARTAEELAVAAVAAVAADVDSGVAFDPAATAGSSTLRRVDANGNLLWQRPDLFEVGGEGFRTSDSQSSGSDEVTIVFACVGTPVDWNSVNPAQPCPYALLGVGTNDGETRWQLDGAFQVSLIADGQAIVTSQVPGGFGAELINVFTGELITAGVSAEPNAFSEECCGGYDYNRVENDGAVAWSIATDALNVWYPADLPGAGVVVDLLGSVTTPQVIARFAGMTIQPAGCSELPCWQLHAAGAGFEPGEQVVISCWLDKGDGWVEQPSAVTATVSADGSVFVEAGCHPGQRAGQVKLTIDGIDSNTLTS